MTVQILIDVTGESAGSPGVARSFAYSKVSPTPPLVTLSLADVTGITEYVWELVSKPEGSSSSLSNPSSAVATFTPTADVHGTYLIQCTVNGGADYSRSAVAFTTKHRGVRIPAPSETTEFGARGWDSALSDFNDKFDSFWGQSPPDGVVTVTHGDTAVENGTLLLAAYEAAKLLTPNGVALSISNRAIVKVPPGVYDLGSDQLELDTNYVDVEGLSAPVSRGVAGGVISPSVRITSSAASTVYQTCANVGLRNIAVENSTAGNICLQIDEASTHALASCYQGLSFESNEAGVIAVQSVVDKRISSSFVDCHTALKGFILGGTFSGIAMRCSGGNGSFAGWDDDEVQNNVVCSGVLVDCVGASYCFGASAKGTATFSGRASRCNFVTYSFGSSPNSDGSFAVIFSGLVYDCTYLSSGTGCFGYAGGGTVLFSGTAYRCTSGSKSFGCCALETVMVTFTGTVEDCSALSDSFCSNSHDDVSSTFTGNLVRCKAGAHSFGNQGYVGGSMRSCVSSSVSCFGNTTTASSGFFVDCLMGFDFGASVPIGSYDSTFINCSFAAFSGTVILLHGDNTKLYNCDLYSPGGGNNAVDAGEAKTVSMAHCRMRVAEGENVTNLLSTPYNVVEDNYSVGDPPDLK